MTDADKEKEIEAGGDGSWEPMPRHKPSRFEFYVALFTIASCASSMVTAITSYVRMQAAAAEVGDVVDNWGLTPITDFKIVSSSANCPSGFEAEHVNYLQQPGPTNLGCGCPTGAGYDGKKIRKFFYFLLNKSDCG